jgi:hypothetical protein
MDNTNLVRNASKTAPLIGENLPLHESVSWAVQLVWQRGQRGSKKMPSSSLKMMLILIFMPLRTDTVRGKRSIDFGACARFFEDVLALSDSLVPSSILELMRKQKMKHVQAGTSQKMKRFERLMSEEGKPSYYLPRMY